MSKGFDCLIISVNATNFQDICLESCFNFSNINFHYCIFNGLNFQMARTVNRVDNNFETHMNILHLMMQNILQKY